MSETRTAGDALVESLNASLPTKEVEPGVWQRSGWDEREAALIEIARRAANDIEALEMALAEQGPMVTGSTGQQRLNPIFAELRQQRQGLAKILSQIKMPDEGMGGASGTSAVKSRAAKARWDRPGLRRAI